MFGSWGCGPLLWVCQLGVCMEIAGRFFMHLACVNEMIAFHSLGLRGAMTGDVSNPSGYRLYVSPR